MNLTVSSLYTRLMTGFLGDLEFSLVVSTPLPFPGRGPRSVINRSYKWIIRGLVLWFPYIVDTRFSVLGSRFLCWNALSDRGRDCFCLWFISLLIHGRFDVLRNTPALYLLRWVERPVHPLTKSDAITRNMRVTIYLNRVAMEPPPSRSETIRKGKDKKGKKAVHWRQRFVDI